MKRQAVLAREQYQVSFVIPVLCFTKGGVELESAYRNGLPIVDRVLISESNSLCVLLRAAAQKRFLG
jgi:hypothetical protein